jgi:hypothetical protein
MDKELKADKFRKAVLMALEGERYVFRSCIRAVY